MVGRSSKNRNFVTKNSTKILKIERGVLKIETTIFGRIGPPQAQLAAPIASGNLNLKTFPKFFSKNFSKIFSKIFSIIFSKIFSRF